MTRNNSFLKYGYYLDSGKEEKGFNYYERIGLAAIFLACIVGNSRNTVISLVIVGLMVFLVPMPEYIFGPLIVFSSYDEYMVAFSGVSLSQVCVILILFGVLVKAKVLKTMKINTNKDTLFIIILMVMGIILSYYSIFGIVSFPKSYVANLLLAIALMSFIPENLARVLDKVHLYCEIVIIYAVFITFTKGNIQYDARLDIEGTNSNTLAMSIAAVCTLIFLKIIQSKERRVLRLAIVYTGYICLFLTGSRSALIGTLFTTIILFIILSSEDKGRLFLLFMVSIALLYVVFAVLRTSYPILMSRYSLEDVVASGGTHRQEAWKNYFKNYFPNYWLFGIGFDSANVSYASYLAFGMRVGAHNIIVEIIASTGVFGLILFSCFFIKYMNKISKSIEKNSYVAISIAWVLTALINGIGENTLSSRFLWFGIGLGYMIVNSNKKLITEKMEIDR